MRRAARRRLGAVVLAVLVACTVLGQVRSSERVRLEWGASATVLVATTDIDAGVRLDTSNTRLDHRPAALVPVGALTERPDGGRTSVAIPAAEPILASRLASPGAGPIAALLPAGTTGVSVERTAVFPAVDAGDRVDVLAPTGSGAAVDIGAAVVADDALVVAVGRESVTLAVSDADVADTAAASMTGLIALVLVGPDGGSGP